MLDITNFQKNVGEWQRQRLLIDEPVWKPTGRVLNSAGDLFELAITKHDDPNLHMKKVAIGEIMIFLADYCDRAGINMEHAVASTWWEMQRGKVS